MTVTECTIENLSPFVNFAGEINFKSEDTLKEICNCDHRLFYIKKGKLTLFMLGEVYELKTGDAVLITSGTPYKMKFFEPTSFVSINFVFITTGKESLPPKSLPKYETKQFRQEFSAEIPHFKCGFLKDKTLILRGVLEIDQLLEKIIIEFKRMEPLYIKIISQYLTTCILIIYRRFISGEMGIGGCHIDILDYISKDFASPLTNKNIADAFHYHPNYVNQIIKEKTGMSLHQYLLRLRLLNATDLLLHTETPINEVAHLSGFSDAGYFSHYFKKTYGCSPTVFKGNSDSSNLLPQTK